MHVYDFWRESAELFYVKSEKGITHGVYPPAEPILLDFDKKLTGDFCEKINVSDGDIIGFVRNPYMNEWEFGGGSLCMYLSGSGFLKTVTVGGKSYECNMELSREWQSAEIEIDNCTIKECELLFSVGGTVYFDNLYFKSDKEIIGITKKSLAQRKEEIQLTKKARMNEAMREGTEVPLYDVIRPFAKLFLGEDIKEANSEIRRLLDINNQENIKEKIFDTWGLIIPAYLCRLYLNFGPEGKIHKNLLEEETKKVVLDVLWEVTKHKNDYHIAEMSTWWLFGSENHDINAKTACLLSSQIFMKEKEFFDRKYPDTGTGGGEGYWFRDKKSFSDNQGPEGRHEHDSAPGKTPKEHYDMWVKFWHEFFDERMKKGFFVEVASPSYMKWTITFLTDIYDYCDDKDLRVKAKKFLDLVWTDWAQDSICGRRGGAKTRRYDWVGAYDSMYTMACYLLGSNGNGVHAYFNQTLSDYELPDHVIKMALSREAIGEFEYISRKPGEEKPYFPRPFGTERGLLCDTESRLVRYSYVTPHYIMGTQMDHPLAIHSHLSNEARWQGIIFASNPDAIVFPICMNAKGERSHRAYRSVQHKNVLLTQQARSFMQIDPDWFPNKTSPVEAFGVAVISEPDKIFEDGERVFIKYGNANVMIRPAIFGYKWNKEHNFIEFDNPYDIAVIETGTGDFEEFIKKITQNTNLSIGETVVEGFYTVTYSGIDGDELYLNHSNNEPPRVNGNLIDYSPQHTFLSPYFKSVYGDKNNEIILNESI